MPKLGKNLRERSRETKKKKNGTFIMSRIKGHHIKHVLPCDVMRDCHADGAGENPRDCRNLCQYSYRLSWEHKL